MKESSLSLLFFYVFYCGLGNEHCDAARISKRSDEPMQSVLDLFNVTESGKKDAFQSTVRPRIVTDVNLGGHHLAEIFEDTNSSEIVSCNLIGSKELIENILESIPSENVTNLSIEEMDQFIDKCEDRDTSQEGSSLLDSLGDAFHSLVIFPGTKWCGPGDVAKNYDDLGKASDTDRCCREHDHSEDNIPAFGTKHNITNYLPYTMTECTYDKKFFSCLQNVSNLASVTVGVLFFDVLKTKCFEYGYPTECAEYNYWRLLLLDNPCVDEEPDTSKPKEWHIESPPNFLETYIEKKRDEKRKESSESEENEV
ncbi:uncharacterized protein LOC119393585 isoform X1 [Rhipicephalus sanguineus]|uniref:uncharacterized protein LOC119393585 isoform X1 n=1 Tax=Rhipicephalus sanguineus TaxID=34632 RepID=UPI0018962A80|nr:uncharacterized protein LOC119393585 isoform X1 [Rhipicephalus sanguineus]